jgi:hypothetical protein
MTFATTFLGHQGWLLEAGDTHILIDPLLDHRFGASTGSGLSVYPPRRLDLPAFPPIDAVFFTHEHDDHFQIASLHRLDRRIPIHLSARASIAARRVVESMGFACHRLTTRQAVTVGDLEVHAISPRFEADYAGDEWDVMQILVRDRRGRGSFFTSVDMPTSPRALQMFGRDGTPACIGIANNYSSPHALFNWIEAPTRPTRALKHIVAACEVFDGLRPRPEVVLVSGGGWSVDGAGAVLNRSLFPGDSGRIAEALQAMAVPGGMQIRAPLPGDRFRFERNRLVGWAADCPFIQVESPTAWPDRSYDPGQPRLDMPIRLAVEATLSPAATEQLRQELGRLARHLCGTRFFNAASSAELDPKTSLHGRFVLVLYTAADSAHVLEYRPEECDFLATDLPVDSYLAGAACWAADLLALLTGAITPATFTMGHIVGWTKVPAVPLDLVRELWQYAHPLRHPEKYETMYRCEYARLPSAGPQVPAGGVQGAGQPYSSTTLMNQGGMA